MRDQQLAAPDNTAVRVALWRALHVEVDAPPHVFEDEIGLKLAAPDDGWRSRPEMSPFTRPFRASIVARARFIEDLVTEHVARGVAQYVILGAGLDTFAQRRPELASHLLVFEIDRPGPQAWKRQRLVDLGFGIRHSCGSCQWTSRQVTHGGSDWQRRASTLGGRRWWRPAGSACTSRRMRSRQPYARSQCSLPAPRSPCRSCFRSSWRIRSCVRGSSGRQREREPTAHPSSASSRQPRR